MRVEPSLSTHSRHMLTTHSLYTFAVVFFCCYSAVRLVVFLFHFVFQHWLERWKLSLHFIQIGWILFVRFLVCFVFFFIYYYSSSDFMLFFDAHRLFVSSPSCVISFNWIVFPFFSCSMLYARTSKWNSSTHRTSRFHCSVWWWSSRQLCSPCTDCKNICLNKSTKSKSGHTNDQNQQISKIQRNEERKKNEDDYRYNHGTQNKYQNQFWNERLSEWVSENLECSKEHFKELTINICCVYSHQ